MIESKTIEQTIAYFVNIARVSHAINEVVAD